MPTHGRQRGRSGRSQGEDRVLFLSQSVSEANIAKHRALCGKKKTPKARKAITAPATLSTRTPLLTATEISGLFTGYRHPEDTIVLYLQFKKDE